MRRMKRKRRKMRARSKKTNNPHLQPGSLPGVLASASPWNTEESMGRLLSSKTSSNILPEAEHSKGRSFQEMCSVLQRDRAYSKFLQSITQSTRVTRQKPALTPSNCLRQKPLRRLPIPPCPWVLFVSIRSALGPCFEVQTSRVLLLLHLTGESYHNIVLLSVAAY